MRAVSTRMQGKSGADVGSVIAVGREAQRSKMSLDKGTSRPTLVQLTFPSSAQRACPSKYASRRNLNLQADDSDGRRQAPTVA